MPADVHHIPYTSIELNPRGSYVLAYSDPRLEIGKESPFKIKEVLKSITKSDNLRTYTKNKLLTIRTTRSAETQALLASISFGNYNAIFTHHTTLNTTLATVLADTHKST